MNKINKKQIISWLSVFIWMVVIFSFSAQVADDSAKLSGGITETIIKIITDISNIDLDVEYVSHIIRKFAHFSIYLILGILVSNAIQKSSSAVSSCNEVSDDRKCSFTHSAKIQRRMISLDFPRHKKRTIKNIIIILLICISYAISDELHQMFVPGRGPAIKDVLIDTSGSIVGTFVYFKIKFLYRS